MKDDVLLSPAFALVCVILIALVFLGGYFWGWAEGMRQMMLLQSVTVEAP
jgi:hypothetical protein